MMTDQNYDEIIAEHYRKIAEKDGLAETSTMADTVTREKETRAILDYVCHFLSSKTREQPALIMDVGCGNGYTLEVLSQRIPDQTYLWIEKTDELRSLAVSRFEGSENVRIYAGDIRDNDFSKGECADILICQRVLINLLDEEDQKVALDNLLNAVNLGGMLVFIEAFSTSLATLNVAREEFDIPAMNPAHHNLYLGDGFFDNPGLSPYPADEDLAPSNFLSTHYFVTRVLHPIFLQERPFKRNSEFVKFFTGALKENVGDYAPLKLFVFERV
jgi:SAM-dependent methyltransferase